MLFYLYMITAPFVLTQRRFLRFGIIFLSLSPLWALGQQTLQSCRADLKNDTLIIENQYLARTFLWNNGNLITLSLADKRGKQTWNWVSKDPDSSIPGHTKATGPGQFTTKPLMSQPNQADHLEVSVTAQMGTLAVKRVFRIYPAVAAINCTFYVMGQPSAEWKQAVSGTATGLDFKNIEATKDLNSINTTIPVLDKLSFPGNHWQLHPVEFFDMTDRNNTLVNQTTCNLYRLPGFLTGNLLLIKDLVAEHSFFVLKEAPTSRLQLANIGFDFLAKLGSIQTVGMGIVPSDVSGNEWLRGYGYTFGLGGKTELETLQTLRRYQDASHPRQPDRDEMVMMNTWGDRNKDTKVREQFIITELQKAAKLGVTRFQIDDGWQLGRSINSATPGGSSEDIYNNPNYWTPDPDRFPNGFTPVIDAAKKEGIELGLWFSPSIDSSFKNWDRDAKTLIGLYNQYKIRTFKIDLVQIPNKLAEVNFRKFLDTVLVGTNYQVLFNMDVTAGRRNGYHFMNEYGNLFLENRYTDWTNYYPYWTLRNLWDLSKYVPPQNLQIEFLNKWRNADKYPAGDPFAPKNYSFDYLFAITMMAQPLAWFEATGLPDEAFATSELIKTYLTNRPAIHGGQIFPIGEEPNGRAWTGFQSIKNEKEGFLLVFRENNDRPASAIKTWLPVGKRVRFRAVAGAGKPFDAPVLPGGMLAITLPTGNSFALYRYEVIN